MGSPPQGTLSFVDLGQSARALPFAGSGDTSDPAKGSLTFVGGYVQVTSIGAFNPAIRSIPILNQLVQNRPMRVSTVCHALDGTTAFLPLFAEQQKSEFNDLVGFSWNGVSTLSTITRRLGVATTNTVSKTPAFMAADHEYTIDYRRDTVQFIIDGVAVTTHQTNIPAPNFTWQAAELNGVAGSVFVKFPYIYMATGEVSGTALQGEGLATIYAAVLQKSESALDNNVLTYTPPTIAACYRLHFAINVSAATAATLGWTATWKDSNGTAQTPTNLDLIKNGVAAPGLTFLAAVGDTYVGDTMIDVDASGTAIVFKLTFTGTSFTAKVSAILEQLA